MEYATIVISLVFVNNFVLAKFLGLCPFVGVSGKFKAAASMGMAVTFVMTMASAVTYPLYALLKWFPTAQGWDLTFLRTIVFILVIASLVQFVEMVIQKTSPALYSALGIYLPLITTNCAVLGVSILNIDEFFGGTFEVAAFFKAVVQGFSAGLGFTLAMLLMAGIRERLEVYGVPDAVKDIPITFISAGLMSLAFLGFGGIV